MNLYQRNMTEQFQGEALSKDERRFTWSDDEYSVKTLVQTMSGNFPIIVRISSGWLSYNTMPDFQTGEVYRVHGTACQKRVLAVASEKECYGIPLDHRLKFNLKRTYHPSKTKEEVLTMDEIVTKHMMEGASDLAISRNPKCPEQRFEFLDCQEQLSAIPMPELTLEHCYDERYLLVNAITDGKLVPRIEDSRYEAAYFTGSYGGMQIPEKEKSCVALPTYLPLEVTVATGLAQGTDAQFQALMDSYTKQMADWDTKKATFNKEILMYDEFVPGGDYEYILPGFMNDQQTDKIITEKKPVPKTSGPPLEIADKNLKNLKSKSTKRASPNSYESVNPPTANTYLALSTSPTATSHPVPSPEDKPTAGRTPTSLAENKSGLLHSLPKLFRVGSSSPRKKSPRQRDTASSPPPPPPALPPRQTPSQPGRHNRPAPETPAVASLSHIPEDISGLTVNKLADCLRYLNMDEYTDSFRTNCIDGAFLRSVSDEGETDFHAHVILQHEKFGRTQGLDVCAQELETLDIACSPRRAPECTLRE